MNKVRVLFLSYDGMTDPLGQSQVIPYLGGLAKQGYSIGIVSFEKKERFDSNKIFIGDLLQSLNINWYPLSYTTSPPIFSTIYDVFRLNSLVKKLNKETPISILHCRSYITSLIGVRFKKKLGIKFIFDMRAFYADERVDGGIWNLDKWIYKTIYNYFKAKEVDFLNSSDYTISLTNAGKRIIHSWGNLLNQPVPIKVIPCCADLNHFSEHSIDRVLYRRYTNDLNLEGAFVLSYLGSLGTWYMEKEMFRFFKALKINYPNAIFLIITPDKPEDVYKKATEENIDKESIRVIFGKRAEVPTLLRLSHISIFFIQPLFSKQGSSPTKHGEILGMGIPVICNSGVGDVEEIIAKSESGALVKEFTDEDFNKAISQIPSLLEKNKSHYRKAAEEWYSLETGIKRYSEVYSSILNQ